VRRQKRCAGLVKVKKIKVGVIEGNIHRDERGVVRFVNDFDMKKVVRMYCIKPKLGVVRAWQGHKRETKWFYVAKGSF